MVEATRSADEAHSLDGSDPAALARFQQVLAAAGYSEEGVSRALHTAVGRAARRADLPLHLLRLADPLPLHTLIKLFLLGVPVPAGEAEAALAPLALPEVIALGLLQADGGLVQSAVAVAAHDGLLLVHDQLADDYAGTRPQHVLGVTLSSLTLAGLTPRRPAHLALDLGCGCGIQALLAARHCDRVIATDVNPRAQQFARFNARLNAIANVEFRQGSYIEPVAGCRFDLIVSNPPYVISPESQIDFRDSGLPGDTVCSELVRRAPSFLSEGGLACMLCNWAHADAGEAWAAPLYGWLEGSDCDAVLLHAETEDGLTYAGVWNRTPDAPVYGASLDRWLEYYRRLGIGAISAGAVVLRRRSGRRHWVRTQQLPEGTLQGAGRHILRLIAAEDVLAKAAADGGGAEARDDAIKRLAFRLVEDHRLEQSLVSRDGRYEVAEMQVRLSGGLQCQGVVDAYALGVLAQCDGRHTLGEIVAALARATGADPSELSGRAVAVVRKLLAYGFVVVAGGDSL
jgi:SAM-dependent methyltransferase